jgi:hypothetical protein
VGSSDPVLERLHQEVDALRSKITLTKPCGDPSYGTCIKYVWNYPGPSKSGTKLSDAELQAKRKLVAPSSRSIQQQQLHQQPPETEADAIQNSNTKSYKIHSFQTQLPSMNQQKTGAADKVRVNSSESKGKTANLKDHPIKDSKLDTNKDTGRNKDIKLKSMTTATGIQVNELYLWNLLMMVLTSTSQGTPSSVFGA